MSVTADTTITPRPWRGYDDPGLPVGTYLAQILVPGDGTGGISTAVFRFKNLTSAASGRYYSLEQVETHTTVATVQLMDMFSLNFDQVGNTTLNTRHWLWTLINNQHGEASIDYQDISPPMPLLLGQTTRLGTQQSSLTFQVDNVDVSTLVVTIQGYIWEARSVQSQGGLRRPMDAIYGR